MGLILVQFLNKHCKMFPKSNKNLEKYRIPFINYFITSFSKMTANKT